MLDSPVSCWLTRSKQAKCSASDASGNLASGMIAVLPHEYSIQPEPGGYPPLLPIDNLRVWSSALGRLGG